VFILENVSILNVQIKKMLQSKQVLKFKMFTLKMIRFKKISVEKSLGLKMIKKNCGQNQKPRKNHKHEKNEGK
jgi:hypothetical protein